MTAGLVKQFFTN